MPIISIIIYENSFVLKAEINYFLVEVDYIYEENFSNKVCFVLSYFTDEFYYYSNHAYGEENQVEGININIDIEEINLVFAFSGVLHRLIDQCTKTLKRMSLPILPHYFAFRPIFSFMKLKYR